MMKNESYRTIKQKKIKQFIERIQTFYRSLENEWTHFANDNFDMSRNFDLYPL